MFLQTKQKSVAINKQTVKTKLGGQMGNLEPKEAEPIV